MQADHVADVPGTNIEDVAVSPRVRFANATNVINLTDLGTLIIFASEHDDSAREVEKRSENNGIQKCTVWCQLVLKQIASVEVKVWNLHEHEAKHIANQIKDECIQREDCCVVATATFENLSVSLAVCLDSWYERSQIILERLDSEEGDVA